MNAIVYKFLLAGDKFMSKTHLRRPGFTCSACSPFTENKEKTKNIEETGDSRYIYQNKLDKACFQHDVAYGDFKDLNRRIAADKVRDKAFDIAKNPKYDGYKRGHASMVYKFFDKKTSGSVINNICNKELAKDKPNIKKFNKRIVHSPFIDNIWGADLADMQLISKFNKGYRFLLCVIDIYSRYAWVIILKDKKGIAITNAFQKVLDESNRKPNKIWVDTGSEFEIMKSWLEKNDVEMYSTHNEGKSVIAERFIRTLLEMYKYMTSISKNAYLDKLDDIVNKYKNTYHSTIKMKPTDVKSKTYIDSIKEIDDKNPKF